MGQKLNATTLRKNFKKTLSFSNSIKDMRSFQCGFNFLNSIETLLSKKNIIVTKKELNLNSNLINLNFTVFFENAKLSKYKKLAKKISNKSKKFVSASKKLVSLFTGTLTSLKSNLVLLNLKVLNSQVNKNLLKKFYQKTTRFKSILFQRKFNLFIDFIKIITLFHENKVRSLVFLGVLGKIFKVLTKKKHNRFLFFLKHIFQMIIQIPVSKSISNQDQIRGIKFIISGKLQGKTRGSNSSIQVGTVPIQSIEKDIEFSKLHVYTRYGAFGFKIWVYRN